MPLYDFMCAAHGVFADFSAAGDNGVESRMCPQCGELSPQRWFRAPSVRDGSVHAVKFGGRVLSRDLVEEQLATVPVEKSFVDDPDFDRECGEVIDQLAGRWFAGELPSPDMDEKQRAVLVDGISGGK